MSWTEPSLTLPLSWSSQVLPRSSPIALVESTFYFLSVLVADSEEQQTGRRGGANLRV